MKITTQLNENFLPDRYTKHANATEKSDGYPVVSFPFTVSDLPEGTRYLAWSLVDFDAVPVGGFVWIHWLGANYATDSQQSVAVPEDLARQGKETAFVPGSNSLYSKYIDEQREAYINGYIGPMPPNEDHDYTLTVYALSRPLPLTKGFFLNQLRAAIRQPGVCLDKASVELPVHV